MSADKNSTSTTRTHLRWSSQRLWEPVSCALIAIGLIMLMQPWSIQIYGYSFTVLLLGVVGFTVAGKLPKE
jgi:hypothetical protein